MTKDEELALVADTAQKLFDGGVLDEETMYKLADVDTPEAVDKLYEYAAELTARLGRDFDSCSIVNARSGRCSEDCKWCAQSGRFHTGCQTYDIVDRDEALGLAKHNKERGVRRFSLVASGRAVKGRTLDQVCDILKEAAETTGIETCASLGLLNRQELEQLYASGARRYHCNLETAPSYFTQLCTTHTHADKLATIAAAREVGFKICSGGIIGMGETRRQRVELALKLRGAKPVSIPINILCPIPGTPLEHTPLISEEEILRTVALFRFAHPTVQLRFAGGRERLSKDCLLKCLHVGINGAITGDLLTTTGATIASDKALVEEAGYTF